MITRQDIDNEAAWVRQLIELQNPTGGKHTPTPWKKAADDMCAITDGPCENWIASFERVEDRDLALYFANAHAAIIALLRDQVQAWRFMHMAVGGDGSPAANFCSKQMENLQAYADVLCRLGKVE